MKPRFPASVAPLFVVLIAVVVFVVPVPRPVLAQERTLEQFVGQVTRDIDEYWRLVLEDTRWGYRSPRVNWFSREQILSTSCGRGHRSGPFYCSEDETIYLERAFFRDPWLRRQDAAVVTVIAHEYGHHVQEVLGMNIISGGPFNLTLELQADCFAGMFLSYANKLGWLEPGDLEEAIDVSLRYGDSPWPDGYEPTFEEMEREHGQPAARKQWLLYGFHDTSKCYSIHRPW